jgi:hypothetical protein
MADMVKSLPNVALEHCLNHLHYGTLGRISYNPADNDILQVGRLQTNRAIVPKSYYGCPALGGGGPLGADRIGGP